MGDLPVTDDDSVDNQLSQGEFLFATRQFDQASALLYRTAQSLSKSGSGWMNAYRALTLWLVIEVRAKDRPEQSARQIENYSRSYDVPTTYRPILSRWAADLRTPAAGGEALEKSESLLADFRNDTTFEADEMRLVTTLRATAMLHSLLEQSPSANARRRATFLLGVAYYHIPLPLFEPFAEQYLELCIRDYPHTPEAFRAFTLYQDRVYSGLGVTGDSGLSPEQERSLTELRNLASPGSKQLIEQSRAHL